MNLKNCKDCMKEIDEQARRCPFCRARQNMPSQLLRNLDLKLLAGVCAGIATHYDWDINLVRVAVVVSFFLLGPITLTVYAVMWLLIPVSANEKSLGLRAIDWVVDAFSAPANRKVPPPNSTPIDNKPYL